MNSTVTIDKMIQVYALFARNMNRKNSSVITNAEINQKYQSCERQERSSYGRSEKEIDLFYNAVNHMVKCGFISEIKKGVYKYHGNLNSLRERIQYLQNVRNGIDETEEIQQKSVNNEQLSRYKVIGSCSYTIEESDDNDDGLDLDDDDDLDFEGIIKFRKEMYDEPLSSNSEKNEDKDDIDEDDDDMDELDKLLKEMSNEIKIQYIVKSSDDAKTYVARRCETKDEAKQLCKEIQEDINSETAIYFLKAYVYFDSMCDDEYIEFRRENA